METSYDAILFVSFGGPEKPEDVIPFLENVLRGKNVPRERMLEVAEHYYHFDGRSPINEQNLNMIERLRKLLQAKGPELPIYWGNRNWHPLFEETIGKMKSDGVKRAIAFFTSSFSCYSGCRQYRENIIEAREKVGEGAPIIDKLRMPYNHPLFIQAQVELVRESLLGIPESEREAAPIFFCAHSIPMSMADNSRYETQLRESARLICQQLGHSRWELVYQSRSGPPQQPWLEPDVCDRIEQLHGEQPLRNLVVTPLGFMSDHMEVMYDLDIEAADTCRELGIQMKRTPTVSASESFIEMIRELLIERMNPGSQRQAIGQYPANHDVCPVDCCLYPRPTGGPGGRPIGGAGGAGSGGAVGGPPQR